MTVETTGASDQDGVKEDTQPAIKKDMTLAELKGYTGKDGSEPVLVAIKGCIYDVTAVRLPLLSSRDPAPTHYNLVGKGFLR